MKKIHYFLINQRNLDDKKTNLKELKIGESFSIFDRETIRQFKDILRFRIGELVNILDGTGLVLKVEIEALNKEEVKVKILEKEIREESNKKVILAFSLPKKDKFELILEKCTEIGADSFQPLVSDRTEKKEINIERSLKIIKEATEQAERAFAPELKEVQKLEDFVKNNKNIIVLDKSGDLDMRDIKPEGDLIVLVGPEGGFSERELTLFNTHNLEIRKLRETILKAETACILGTFLAIDL